MRLYNTLCERLVTTVDSANYGLHPTNSKWVSASDVLEYFKNSVLANQDAESVEESFNDTIEHFQLTPSPGANLTIEQKKFADHIFPTIVATYPHYKPSDMWSLAIGMALCRTDAFDHTDWAIEE